MSDRRLHIWVEGAIIAAMAMALEYLPHSVGPWVNLSYGVIPVAIFSLRRGAKAGLATGLVWGLLDLFLRGFGDGGFLNPLQGVLEYPVAFSVVGLIGLGAAPLRRAIIAQAHNRIIGIALGYTLLGVIIKYFCHFLAGVIYWGSYAPKGMNPWLYSLAVNGGSALANTILSGVLIVLLARASARLFSPRDTFKAFTGAN
ncbi:energy-coupled thiamine transporter ThiT [Loigolactobacillus iwatensis]|uniref:energy-coupled thiamine transporter ThiT n=1 Tax=Loigolactobacillus iwatensis TaxID=1267156 RepID=UPI000F7E05E8|nr:energy-coupled thiamine transporter ThiT [Loigolactobacillus iwatensis]